MDLSDIEIIVSEIDGVITDGRNATDYLNNIIFKSFYTADFEFINYLKTYFTFVFLSSDPSISYNVMRQRNIPTYFSSSNESKLNILNRKILPRYNTSTENLIYIGSKLSDIQCMNSAEISMTLSNTSFKLKRRSNYIFSSSSGNGVITELYDLLTDEIKKRERK